MSVMNTFMNMGGGELTKDLTPFVSHNGGIIDYARYMIASYTGSKESTGVERDATHVFWGMIHFKSSGRNIRITMPESYTIVGSLWFNLPVLASGSSSMDTVRFQLNDDNTILVSNDSDRISGFIFLSFLCYK